MLRGTLGRFGRGRNALVIFGTCAAILVSVAAPLTSPADAAPATSAALSGQSTAKAPGHLDPGLPTTGRHLAHVVVSARPGATPEAIRATAALGGRIGAALPIVDGFAASVPACRLRALADDPAVLAVTADRSARLDDLTFDATKTASSFVTSTGANQAWSRGDYGSGVGVAVIDTGVSDVDDLAGRVIHGPDLSGEGTSVDTFGHGTVMAGLIAGDGTDSAAVPKADYVGVAPRANVIAVKVAGRNASVDVSTMLQAMHWVAAYSTQFNIRVLNLSWGVPSTQDPAVDPLDYAVERLWRLGIVVVVAAGNQGPGPGTITKPGDDPLAITVGAYDDRNDTIAGDDVMPDWSSRGPTASGLTKPDLVAPGRKLIAVRSFGSYIEQTYPKALIAPSYIRGSGTSEATAVVSGLVALLVAQRPSLTPDQVKFLLKSTALPMRGETPNDQGAGRVQAGAALLANALLAPVQLSVATGLGSIEASRGGVHVTAACGDTATPIVGEIDVHCEPWNGATWTGTTWTGTPWTGTTWTSQAWTPAAWTGTTWTGGVWTGGSWLGVTPWTGTTWTGTTWTGTTWTGTTWTGTTWTDAAWTGNTWAGVFQTAFWGAGPVGRSLPGEQTQPADLPAVTPDFLGGLW